MDNNANNELIQENVKLTQKIKQLELELAKRNEELAAKDKELETTKELLRHYWNDRNENYSKRIASSHKFRERFENICLLGVMMVFLFIAAVVMLFAFNGIATLCVWLSSLI